MVPKRWEYSYGNASMGSLPIFLEYMITHHAITDLSTKIKDVPSYDERLRMAKELILKKCNNGRYHRPILEQDALELAKHSDIIQCLIKEPTQGNQKWVTRIDEERSAVIQAVILDPSIIKLIQLKKGMVKDGDLSQILTSLRESAPLLRFVSDNDVKELIYQAIPELRPGSGGIAKTDSIPSIGQGKRGVEGGGKQAVRKKRATPSGGNDKMLAALLAEVESRRGEIEPTPNPSQEGF